MTDEIVLGEPLVFNQEISTSTGITLTVVCRPHGIIITVKSVEAPIDYFLISLTLRDTSDQERSGLREILTNRSPWGHDHATFNVEPSNVKTIFVIPVRQVGRVAAFAVKGEPLQETILVDGAIAALEPLAQLRALRK